MSSDGILDPFKDTIIKVAVKETAAALISRLPFLSFGPVGIVLSYVLSKLFSYALDKTILGVNLYLIDLQTNRDVDTLRGLINEASKTPKHDKQKMDEIEKKITESARDLIKLYDHRRL